MTPRIRLFINGLLVLALAAAAALVILGWHELPMAAVWGRLLISVGLGGAIAIGVMFLLPLELRANLTLMGMAVLVTLWLASWILYEPELSDGEIRQRDFEAAALEADVPFDARPPSRVIKDLRRTGADAAASLSAWALFDEDLETHADALAGLLRADGQPPVVPFAGPSRATTVSCNEQGDYLIVETDRYGYNNPDEVYETTAPVLILGDSFAFGFCVRAGYDVGNQLRARDVGVVNLGYPGTGPLIQLAQLREYGPVIQPAIILWLYYNGNDRVNLSDEYDEPALRSYLDPGHDQDLATRQPEIDGFWAEYIERIVMRADERQRLPLGDILLLKPLRDRLVGRVAGIRGRLKSRAPIERFEESLSAMIAEAQTLDATLYFVFLPTYSQFAENNGSGAAEDRDAVLGAVRAHGLPIIDLEARFRETGDPLQYFPYRKHGHYTEAAYALLAGQILERLHQDSLQIPTAATP